MKSNWLVEGDKERSQRELEKFRDYWQHELGLCRYGIKIEKSNSSLNGSATPSFDERLWIIKANSERVLLHELLHVLFSSIKVIGIDVDSQNDWDTQMIIFQLTNTLLRHKYRR